MPLLSESTHSDSINHLNSAFECERERKKPLFDCYDYVKGVVGVDMPHKVKSMNSNFLLSSNERSPTTASCS